ncbi:WD40 repeat domain-containing protein [Streptomyces sp. NPDC058676]|uniref:WD40 repeat domain-containing protein n=1 Tax=unclassified Streptomyces TaxID=2593676 RepID=UPI003654F72D
MTEQQWHRPAAGREPAATALLAWLADANAPRLCVVSGSEGCGKSALLAWLVAHGTRPGTGPQRRVHGFVPLAGQTPTTTAWTLAEQLSLPARTPGELVSMLADDTRRTVIVLPELHAAADVEAVCELALHLLRHEHIRLIIEIRTGQPEAVGLMTAHPAVMDLDHTQWTDPVRYAAWEEDHPELPTSGATAAETAAAVDLGDAAAVCTADPWQISRRYEQSENNHGGLRAAWLRAGSSLTRDQTAADRALTLLSALGDDADPRLPDQLGDLTAGAAWEMVWRRVRGDIRPPWPGPARAMTAGHGALTGFLVVADHQDTVRMIDACDGAPRGRLPALVTRPRSVSTCSDGTVLVLDGNGHLHAHPSALTPKPTGIAALLDDGPSPLERLLALANGHLKDRPGTAVAASESVLAVADEHGSVHVYVLDGDEERHRTARIHEAGVAALAVVELPGDEGDMPVPLVCSGGTDGQVRIWQPRTDPLDAPVASRSCPVTALAAVDTPDAGLVLAIGWGDGLVEYVIVDSGDIHAFRPGIPVESVAVTREGLLAVGTDETLVCLRPV